MGEARVSVVVTTDSVMDKYGGVRLAPELLHSMAAALNAGSMPMNFDHDPRHPIEVSDIEARVEARDDGVLAVVADFTIDEDDWAWVQQRFDEAGVQGGFSFVGSETLGELGVDGAVRVMIAAEAGHFEDEDILDAGEAVGAVTRVRVERLYQFTALDEVARIIIEAGPGVLSAVGTSVVGSAIYAALERLLGRKRRSGKTMIDVRTQTADGRSVQAIIVTEDPAVARHAVETLMERTFETTDRAEYDTIEQAWVGEREAVGPASLAAESEPLDEESG